MKKFLFVVVLFCIGFTHGWAQDVVGLTHKQVLEYWQSKVPADQINDGGDLVVIGDNTFCSFNKKTCVEFITLIPATEISKYTATLNSDKQLRHDQTKNVWINDVKKFVWSITKSDESNFQVDCKML